MLDLSLQYTEVRGKQVNECIGGMRRQCEDIILCDKTLTLNHACLE